jgi:hypothetical protein
MFPFLTSPAYQGLLANRELREAKEGNHIQGLSLNHVVQYVHRATLAERSGDGEESGGIFCNASISRMKKNPGEPSGASQDQQETGNTSRMEQRLVAASPQQAVSLID